LGYTGELSEKEVNDEYYKLRYYRRGDRIGRTGAEAVFEDRLRGRDGKELVEVDAHGKIVRILGRDKEIPGEDIMLSIDADLQKKTAESFPVSEKGAVIVARPATGEILAMYSSPSYDLNDFSEGLSQAQYEALLSNPDQPLFDRAIGGVYPPGSTFKIVTSLGAMEEGAIKKDTTVEDVGVLTIGPFSFPNWYFKQYGKTDGAVDLVKALQRSNDIYFYKVGEWLGITKLVAWSRKVGIGKPLGIELGGEASGLMPDPAWKKEHFSTPEDQAAHNDEWYLGDTYHISIGQGYLLVTPLQVNTWTNIIANKGAICRPTIKKVTGMRLRETNCKDIVVKNDTIDVITGGMKAACEAGGTGWPLFNFGVPKKGAQMENPVSTSSANLIPVPVACKTGTAEFGHPKNDTHAWFTAFAPLPSEGKEDDKAITGDPEISVTVLVEGAGEGSSVAAPIAKKILEEWFSR
jgi:penicillin-binding protein 2